MYNRLCRKHETKFPKANSVRHTEVACLARHPTMGKNRVFDTLPYFHIEGMLKMGSKKRQRKPSITQTITKQVIENLQKVSYDKTRKQYLINTKRFIKFCREKYDCKGFEECR